MNFTRLIAVVLFSMIISPTVNAYELKTIVVQGYSKPWVMLTASAMADKIPNEVHLHLHGWTQVLPSGKPFEQRYDFEWPNSTELPSEASLRKFVEAYDLHQLVEKEPKRAIIIPIARGRCDQYPELLQGFDETWKRVLQGFGFDESVTTLKLGSAHSGGGEVLSKLLVSGASAFSQVNKVVLVDAIYHDSTRERLMKWVFEAPQPKVLMMPVVVGMSPHQQGGLMMKTSGPTPMLTSELNLGSAKVLWKEKQWTEGTRLVLLHEPKPSQLDHWSLVKAIFGNLSFSDLKRTPSSKKSSR